MNSAGEGMLQAAAVYKQYTSGPRVLEVLKGVTFSAQAGEVVAVVGPSGAGKSTLLHILGGLDAPTKGSVTFEGRDLYALGDNELSSVRNARIGFVFQFYHLLPEFTVLENVMFPAVVGKAASPNWEAARARALSLLQEVGLADRQSHFPSELSGGEKQRTAVVRALMNRPALLLCDEPTGNLDSQSGAEVFSLLRTTARAYRMAVVMVTHNMELARGADRVCSLRDGSFA